MFWSTRKNINCYIILIIGFMILLPEQALAKTNEINFISGEVIVKFKSDLQLQKSIGTFSSGTSSSISSASDSINSLMQKYGAEESVKVFQAVPKSGISAQSIDEKVRRRSGRIPKKTSIPNLSNIYKLSFSKEINIQTIIEDFKKNPNIE